MTAFDTFFRNNVSAMTFIFYNILPIISSLVNVFTSSSIATYTTAVLSPLLTTVNSVCLRSSFTLISVNLRPIYRFTSKIMSYTFYSVLSLCASPMIYLLSVDTTYGKIMCYSFLWTSSKKTFLCYSIATHELVVPMSMLMAPSNSIID